MSQTSIVTETYTAFLLFFLQNNCQERTNNSWKLCGGGWVASTDKKKWKYFYIVHELPGR